MSAAAFVATTAGAALLPVALGLALRRHLHARLYRDTGLGEWKRIARQLPARDRRWVYRTTMRGEAAPPRLVGPAAQRAETMIAVLDRMTDPTGAFRKVWIGLGVLFLLLAAISVVGLARDSRDWSTAGNAALESALGVFFLLERRLLRRQRRRLQRSLELNRAAAGA